MGSIAAILARSIPVDTNLTRRMLAASPHRGSDFIVRICGSCVLGLSNQQDFIDSTMSRDSEFMAVFSGKLDNAAELQKMLATAGHAPASRDAADITVSMFKAFGPDAPNYMRGAFAGIVTDGTHVWCFRDHIGFQPLFYRDDPHAFFAATEPKQIIAGADLQREPDLEVLERIFYGKTPADMPSALKGIDRLPQATTLVADSKQAHKLHRYWKPADILETARYTPTEAGERFVELFTQAITRNLTGMDDIMMLSGGVDSSAIAAFAAPQHFKMTGRPMNALSAVFPRLERVDET
jgi:asparagine synthase (glutamine-hydrolysing)